MSSSNNTGACGRDDSGDQGLAKQFKSDSVSIATDEENEDDVTVQNVPSESECKEYRIGMCQQSRVCGRDRHPHIRYPSACNWDQSHMSRLHFECHCFNVARSLHITGIWPGTSIISEWLSSDEDSLRRILTEDENGGDKDYGAKMNDSPGIVSAFSGHATTQIFVARELPNHLQGEEDGFLQLLTSLTGKYDIKTTDKRTLYTAVHSGLQNQNTLKIATVHRSTLLTWIKTCQHYGSGALAEKFLDELVVGLVNSAAQETACPVIVSVRDSTERTISVCGQSINIASNVEVSGGYEGVLQVMTFTNNKALSGPKSVTRGLPHALPQIAGGALALATDSPFGNKHYKTVYQMSVHATHSDCENDDDQVHVLLVRSHVARTTLQRMPECPIPNPLNRSYILYEKVACGKNIYSESFITFVYLAIKAAMVLFQSCSEQAQ
ncbi:uncharacterized protein [Ptychodera flava]|uniref:uncharacterized protein n=1 Tax=Ptychodera flava TaxID=63121 RepID=UPI00396A58CC